MLPKVGFIQVQSSSAKVSPSPQGFFCIWPREAGKELNLHIRLEKVKFTYRSPFTFKWTKLGNKFPLDQVCYFSGTFFPTQE